MLWGGDFGELEIAPLFIKEILCLEHYLHY
jgi:hypothetical protein